MNVGRLQEQVFPGWVQNSFTILKRTKVDELEIHSLAFTQWFERLNHSWSLACKLFKGANNSSSNLERHFSRHKLWLEMLVEWVGLEQPTRKHLVHQRGRWLRLFKCLSKRYKCQSRPQALWSVIVFESLEWCCWYCCGTLPLGDRCSSCAMCCGGTIRSSILRCRRVRRLQNPWEMSRLFGMGMEDDGCTWKGTWWILPLMRQLDITDAVSGPAGDSVRRSPTSCRHWQRLQATLPRWRMLAHTDTVYEFRAVAWNHCAWAFVASGGTSLWLSRAEITGEQTQFKRLIRSHRLDVWYSAWFIMIHHNCHNSDSCSHLSNRPRQGQTGLELFYSFSQCLWNIDLDIVKRRGPKVLGTDGQSLSMR